MEPEEEIAEAEIGEQRRLGTARRVSARTPHADSQTPTEFILALLHDWYPIATLGESLPKEDIKILAGSRRRRVTLSHDLV